MVEGVDLETFEARHGRALAAALIEHARFAFLLPRLKGDDVPKNGAGLWSAGEGTACALLWRGTLLFGDLDSAAVDAIVEGAMALDLRRIAGSPETVDRAVAKCRQAGLAFSPPLALRTMVLRQKAMVPPTAGGGRTATLDDLECVGRWLSEFHWEALPHEEEPPASAQDARCRRLIDAGNIVLWEHDNAPVSMATMVQDLPSIAAISLVYTPPARRAQGYAGAAVGLLSDRIVASGRPSCLFVDARNPFSYRCYARIGYIAETVHAEAVRTPENHGRP